MDASWTFKILPNYIFIYDMQLHQRSSLPWGDHRAAAGMFFTVIRTDMFGMEIILCTIARVNSLVLK